MLDRLQCDPKLRCLCGWERVGDIPSESTFSRAFAEFAEMALPERMHAALIASAFADTVVGHIDCHCGATKANGQSLKTEDTPQAVVDPATAKPDPKSHGVLTAN